jgi:hypothetical protein
MSILTNPVLSVKRYSYEKPAGVEKIARAGYEWAALDNHREFNR